MRTDHYKGYALWGHAIAQPAEGPEQVRYAASGTVMREGKLVAASDVLDTADDDTVAQQLGLEWARAWVDSHG